MKKVPPASVLSLQSLSVCRTQFDAPEADRFAADSDPSFSEKVFNISMAQIETIVEPYSVADDIGRKSVALGCIHGLILAILDS